MKVLLITENIPFEPLGIGYLASALLNEGHNVKYSQFDSSKRAFNKFKPDFVGMSIITGSHNKFIELSKYFKQMDKKTKIIAGGPHPTYFPEIINNNSIDYVIRGDGEDAICKLVKNPKEGVVLGSLEENLDNISFPNRDVIYKEMINEERNPVKHIIGSRGCPFDCPYCYNSGFKELYKGHKTVRYRSVSNIIEELKELKSKYNAKFIQFQDDSFTSNKKWFYGLMSAYKSEINLPFHAIVRLDQLDEDSVKRLKNSGCVSVRTALESGNDYLRIWVLNRNMSKEQIRESCRLLHKFDIKFMLQNILGLPQGDLDSDIETLEFNKELKPTYAWASIFQPYPRTKLGNECNADIEKIKPNFYEDSVLNIKNKKERKELRNNFARLVNGKTIEEANNELYLGLI